MTPAKRTAMRIKEWRDRRDMTQEELAAKAGISRGFLARLEMARHDPKLSTLEKIAKALRVEIAQLLK